MSREQKIRLGILQKPQWFIRFEDNHLDINEDVMKTLRGLECHIVVVTVIGSLRTGKSWILNQLAGCDGVKNGFDVADGQTAVTSGIWTLCREHPILNNCVVMFVDTEGLHDPFKNSTGQDDNRLSTLSFLLSDKFIYNVEKKLDNNDLEKIGFITMISKKLQEQEAQESFPEFILLLRDAPRVIIHYEEVEPKKYLENILESVGSDGHQFSPKWCIREYCKKRTCFILTQPTTDFEDLSKLGQCDHPKLKPRFEEDLEKLKAHLFGDSDKRLDNGSLYTANAFCEYTHALVQALEGGAIPNVSSLQQRIAEEENKSVLNETFEVFRSSIRNDEKSILYGSPSEKFKVLQREGIERLQNRTITKSKQHLNEVIENFKVFSEEEYKNWSKEKCREFLTCHLETYFNMIGDNCYKAPNAKEKFEKDVGKVKEKYDKMENCGPEKLNVWNEMEREIRKRMKELELVDLQFQQKAAETLNKDEKERLDQRIRQMEAEVYKQKLDMAQKELEQKRKVLEIEQDRKRDQMEMNEERKRNQLEMERDRKGYAAEMKQLQNQLREQADNINARERRINEREAALRTPVEPVRESQNMHVQVESDALVFSSLLTGIAQVGVAALNVIGNIDDDE